MPLPSTTGRRHSLVSCVIGGGTLFSSTYLTTVPDSFKVCLNLAPVYNQHLYPALSTVGCFGFPCQTKSRRLI